MNEIFIIGKVASKVEYKFIVKNKKQYAKAEFEIEKIICLVNLDKPCLK